jgi:hypothetical protein
MPLTLFDSKGIPAHRRERIEAAVTAGARELRRLDYDRSFRAVTSE